MKRMCSSSGILIKKCPDCKVVKQMRIFLNEFNLFECFQIKVDHIKSIEGQWTLNASHHQNVEL